MNMSISYDIMHFNSDILFAKIKQSIALIYNASQVRNASCNDRKVNDLCRCFQYFISW